MLAPLTDPALHRYGLFAHPSNCRDDKSIWSGAELEFTYTRGTIAIGYDRPNGGP